MDFHGTYSANNDNVSRDIAGLNVTFQIKDPARQVYLQWWIFYECEYNVTFQAKRNDTVIGFNTEAGNVRWSGIGVGEYEHSFNTDSTPSYLHLCYVDSPGTSGPHTYSIGVRSSTGTNYTVRINRAFGSFGDNNEGGVSWCMIQEIAA
jgi:hypothetical protein